MPVEMSGPIKSAVVQGKVYIGGGHTDKDSNEYTIMEYDTSSKKWATLPSYRTCLFAMTVINSQLVLVGGWEHGPSSSKVLGEWKADRKKWIYPYPQMPTARDSCSAVSYSEWLVVVGGYDYQTALSSVEILNTKTLQWHNGPPMPIPLHQVKTAAVGNVHYFMGGSDEHHVTCTVYSISIQTLISQTTSRGKAEKQVWTEIPKLPLTGSTPFPISRALLMAGGWNKREAVTDILLYQPNSKRWVKVGNMATPCYNCTCARIMDREILVAGGRDTENKKLKRVNRVIIKQLMSEYTQ